MAEQQLKSTLTTDKATQTDVQVDPRKDTSEQKEKQRVFSTDGELAAHAYVILSAFCMLFTREKRTLDLLKISDEDVVYLKSLLTKVQETANQEQSTLLDKGIVSVDCELSQCIKAHGLSHFHATLGAKIRDSEEVKIIKTEKGKVNK